MAEYLKSPSVMIADLKAHIAFLEERLLDSWAHHEVAIVAVIFLLVGFGMGLAL